MIIQIEDIRREVSSSLDKDKRSELGQYFTPQSIAKFMASLFVLKGKDAINILDAGAGIGSLSVAFLERLLGTEAREVNLTAYEIDEELIRTLSEGLESYKTAFVQSGRSLDIKVVQEDFIQDAVVQLCTDTNMPFNYAILNPPYYKVNSNSSHRKLLRKVRIETVNLYSAFVALALKLLSPGGQLVAIIPRSFCNGPYYKPFRVQLFSEAAVNHIHLFETRNKAFGEDGVLQENIIIHLTKGAVQGEVTLSSSACGNFEEYQEWAVPFKEIVKKDDPEHFIHIPGFEQESALDISENIRFSLADLGLKVSTGPVVDFRVKEYLRKMPEKNTAPLIYPAHFGEWTINHPISKFKKYNAIEVGEATTKWLYPSGYYTLIRRFSSKEEKRRIVSRVIQPEDIGGDDIGFENHLNVFHSGKKGLPKKMAFGLAVYLNSTFVDEYFRLFSGHTQVNATDLKLMKYPSKESLIKLGQWGERQSQFNQEEIDKQVLKIL